MTCASKNLEVRETDLNSRDMSASDGSQSCALFWLDLRPPTCCERLISTSRLTPISSLICFSACTRSDAATLQHAGHQRARPFGGEARLAALGAPRTLLAMPHEQHVQRVSAAPPSLAQSGYSCCPIKFRLPTRHSVATTGWARTYCCLTAGDVLNYGCAWQAELHDSTIRCTHFSSW